MPRGALLLPLLAAAALLAGAGAQQQPPCLTPKQLAGAQANVEGRYGAGAVLWGRQWGASDVKELGSTSLEQVGGGGARRAPRRGARLPSRGEPRSNARLPAARAHSLAGQSAACLHCRAAQHHASRRPGSHHLGRRLERRQARGDGAVRRYGARRRAGRHARRRRRRPHQSRRRRARGALRAGRRGQAAVHPVRRAARLGARRRRRRRRRWRRGRQRR